jgi:trehalose 6-phosphate synthase/phosphatase
VRGLPVSLLEGDKVIEIRPRGVNKGTVMPELMRVRIPGGLVLAAGDDRTDEDLFAALPPDGVSLHVGPRPSRARYQLSSPAALLRLLQEVVDAHAETWAPSPS